MFVIGFVIGRYYDILKEAIQKMREKGLVK